VTPDGGLWAALGAIGTLLLIGLITQVKLLLDIKVELTKSSRRRRRTPEDPV